MATNMATAVATRKNAKTAVVVSDRKARMAEEIAKLQERLSKPGGDRIAVSQDKKLKLPDGTECTEIDAVILDFINVNQYFEGAYDQKNISPPACFAINVILDDMTASANSPAAQCDNCKNCPQNVFGSAGDGKACKNGRRLALLPADADDDSQIIILDVSPTAIKGFDGYVANLARRYGTIPAGVVTRISFDPSSTYAKLVFSDPQPLDDDRADWFYERREAAMERLLVEPDVTGYQAPKKSTRPGRR